MPADGPDLALYGGPPDLPAGHDGIRALFGHIGPVEQRWTVDDVVAEGDRVVVRATNSCTQDELFGVPAHGVRQVFTATFVFRIEHGLVAETWRNADDLGRLFQLGARVEAGAANLSAARREVEDIADRFIHALVSGDAGTLEQLYHPDLRFTVRTAGAAFGRAEALDNFRRVWALLHDVQVEVLDRQLGDGGFVSQHVLTATVPGGARVAVPMCMIFQVRDGQVIRVDEYFDPAAVGPLMALVTG